MPFSSAAAISAVGLGRVRVHCAEGTGAGPQRVRVEDQLADDLAIQLDHRDALEVAPQQPSSVSMSTSRTPNDGGDPRSDSRRSRASSHEMAPGPVVEDELGRSRRQRPSRGSPGMRSARAWSAGGGDHRRVVRAERERDELQPSPRSSQSAATRARSSPLAATPPPRATAAPAPRRRGRAPASRPAGRRPPPGSSRRGRRGGARPPRRRGLDGVEQRRLQAAEAEVEPGSRAIATGNANASGSPSLATRSIAGPPG